MTCLRPAFWSLLALITTFGLSRAATLSVTSTDDDGLGSLRQALATAEVSPEADSIVFDIPGAGPHTLRPLTPLPAIHYPVTIDASTQSGYAGKPVIELDGSLAGLGAWGFEVRGGPCTVRGFAINRFSGGGILLASAGGDVVQANFIGTDLLGTNASPNGVGILVSITQGELIGGNTPQARNVISGNQQAGIALGGSTNWVLGNFIGTDASGTSPVGNQDGINMGGAGNQIGGTDPSAGNLISGNRGYGVVTGAEGNSVRGNYLGTDVTGTIALGGASGPGTGVGVFLWGGHDNQIGDTTHGGRNIISGYEAGVDIRGNRNVVEGNFIGVDVSGTLALPNQNGIRLADIADDNWIGGILPGAGNLISGNAGAGIQVGHVTVSRTHILGNWIGVDSLGAGPLRNAIGVEIDDAVDTTIGGTEAGAGNTIAYNSAQGILIRNNDATGNSIRGNSIYSNGAPGSALGIDLAGNGVSLNDSEDADIGPNQLQNFPDLSEALTSLSTVTISGRLSSTPSHDFELDFFASPSRHASGYGEGHDYLGSLAVTTDAAGEAAFTVSMPRNVPVGWFATATATDGNGNTSEFSRSVEVGPAWPVLISAQTLGNLNGVTLEFSLPPDQTSALDPANYTITGGVVVKSVTLITSHKVRLETSLIAEGQIYTLAVSNVRSLDGAIIPKGSVIKFVQSQGIITRREFDNVAGTSVSDLTNSIKFPSQPDGVSYLTSLEAPSNVGDNYGQQILGFVTAPLTGDYTFYIASDDQSELRLSTDNNPANKQLIAEEPGWNASRLWIGYLNGRLQIPTNFVAGDFFIEAEDFDFAGGHHQPSSDTMPYGGGAYADLSASADVDYHDPGANENVAYRAADQGVAIRSNTDLSRGSYTVGANFQVGWNEAGDWYNYTRVFPTPGQDYYVMARVASGGADMRAQLDAVTAGVGTTIQTTAKLGEFGAPATGSWDLFTLVPLRDDAGNLAIVHLEGETTLRFTVLPGALDFDYLAFKSVATGIPDLSQLRPRNASGPIHLEAGSKYYLEILMKDGSGDDHVAVTWRQPGDPEPTNGAPPIPGQFLSSVDPSLPASIVQQPASQAVNEFGSATFTTALRGTPPFDYQWFRDGVMIPGAHDAAYTVGPLAAADTGATFSVRAGNGLNTLVSSNALLTVIPDTTPPMLISAVGSSTMDQINVRFSEPIDPIEAIDPLRYHVTGGISVNAVELGRDGRSVLLDTTAQAAGVNYTVTVEGIHDVSAARNEIATNSQVAFTAFVLSRGFLRREVFLNLPGGALTDLTNSSVFPSRPDAVNYVSAFESPSGLGMNYGARLSGYLLPPTTGDYVFYIASDDQGALFLSVDDQPVHLAPIALEPQWNPQRQWTNAVNQASRGEPATNVSAAIHLEAGRQYYVEALMKQANGGDHLAVAWQMPGESPPENFTGPIPGTYLAAYAESTGSSVQIVESPHDLTVQDQQMATFSVQASGSSRDRFYQWQANGVDIPGATGRRYTTLPLKLADSGTRLSCIVSVPGAAAVSAQAVLTVVPDAQPPRLIGAESAVSLDQVTLTFSEPVNATDAAQVSHFAMDGDVNILSARLLSDQTNVVLTTSPQTEGQHYTLTVTGLRDRSAASNATGQDTQIDFFAWENEEFVGPFSSWADAKRDFGAVGDGVTDDTDALQRALDNFGANGRPDGDGRPHVLWIPAGKYRITRRLDYFTRIGASVVGEDPATTIIKWDGPANGVMLWANGVSMSRMGRLTFDGSGVALSGIDQKYDQQRNFSTSGNEYADMVFMDLAFGIRAGIAVMDSEVEVRRCRFKRCSQAGISMESFNALDWWIWHCQFEDCHYGVSNTYGAGHYHVYESLFLRSTEADCGHGMTSYFSIRRNVSIGSKAFFTAGFTGNPSGVTLQGNTIIDPLDDTPIRIQFLGPLLLFDNIIRSRPGLSNGPVVSASDNLVAIGNTFTLPNALQSYGRTIAFDNQVISGDQIDATAPKIPGTLPNRHRAIVDVPPHASAAQIQAAITQADQFRGNRPVVHLPYGSYSVTETLVIPSGSDLQLVGDGFVNSTDLRWEAAGEGTVLRVAGPTRASLREFSISGNRRALGLGIDDCDQPSARVFMDQASLSDMDDYNLLADRVEDTDISLVALGHSGSRGPSLRVVGSPKRAVGGSTAGRVVIFGGASSDNNYTYDITHGGSLLVQDCWYEARYVAPFARFSGLGECTLHGANVAPDHTDGLPTVEFDDFHGKATFLTTYFVFNEERVLVDPQNPDLELLLMGVGGSRPDYLQDESLDAEVGLFSSHQNDAITPWINQPDTGSADPAFLKEMLAQTRREKPHLLARKPDGVTDCRLFRVCVTQCKRGVLITGTNTAPFFVTPIPDQVVTEGATIIITNVASDLDVPFNTLTYSLGPGIPAGAWVDPTNGVFTWTPTHSQAPSTNRIDVVVRDDGSPELSATNSVTVIVTAIHSTPFVGDVVVDPQSLPAVQSYQVDALSGDWQNSAGQIVEQNIWTSAPARYLVAAEERNFIVKSRDKSRDQEVDTWMRVGRTFLRLTESGKAIVFQLYLENGVGQLMVGIATGVGEDTYDGTASRYHWLKIVPSLADLLPEYRDRPTDGDFFTFGVDGFDIYARFNGHEFLRFQEYRHMESGAVAFKAPQGYGLRTTIARFRPDALIFSDSANQVLDLRDFGLRDVAVRGSIDAGSTVLRLSESPDPPFRPGDWIILETGGEGGQGQRGTIGVGGVWPALHYPNAASRDADVGQSAGVFCWLDSDGSVWQWDGTGWRDRAHFQNEVGTVSEDYYVAKAVPMALRAVVQTVSSDGLTLTLDEAAQAAGTNETVHYDNSPILNLLATDPRWQPGGPNNDITPAGITLKVPAGRFAVGDEVDVVGYTAPKIVGDGESQSCLFSPKGCPSSTLVFYGSPAASVRSLRVEGNALEKGFGLAIRNPRLENLGRRVTETNVDGYGGPGAIDFGYQCDQGSIRDVSILEAFSPAIEVNYSTNVSLENVRIVRSGLKRGNSPSWRATYLVSWDSDSAGGSVTNLSIDSAAMILGFGVNGGPDIQISGLQARNAVFLFRSSGSLKMSDAQFGFDSGAQEGLDGWAMAYHPVVWVDARQGPGDRISITNLRMEQEGFANSRHDILSGLVLQGTFDVATVLGGQARTPDDYGPPAQSPEQIHIEGGYAWVQGFRVSGKARDRNIYANNGVITNCWADVIRADPPALAIDCWPDSNVPPVLALPAIQTIREGQPLSISLLATDRNFPAQDLSYHLVDAPSGAVIDPVTGLFTWTPVEGQGPSTNRITVLVSDSGLPPLTTTNTLSVVVQEINVVPVLPTIATQIVNELNSIIVTNAAVEPDIHATMSYALLNPPAGAHISSKGVITWIPSQVQSPSTNILTTVAISTDPQDTLTSQLRATNSFVVVVVEVNQAPVLPALANQSFPEQALLRVTNTATVANIHSVLSYELVNAPVGATIDSNGVITWTPDETQGPGTNVITTVATSADLFDLVNPVLSATNSFTVVVREVNTAPVLATMPDQVIEELTTMTATNVAIDVDLPPNRLTFALVSAPNGVNLNSASGVLTWTPTEAQGPSTNQIVVKVTDDGVPPLSATNSFTVVVREVNTAPSLAPVPDQVIDELTTLTMTNVANDIDLPANKLTFALVSAPNGVNLNTASGVLTWTPTEAQGPSTNQITVKVTDDGVPPLSATNSFKVMVNEVNTAPVLATVPDQTINELATLSVTNLATDVDIPANTLTFGLVSAPSGVNLNLSNGVLTWIPTEAQGPSTNQIVVKVSDNGVPPLSATNSFKVVVNEVSLAGTVRFWHENAGVPGVALTLAGDSVHSTISPASGAYAVSGAGAGNCVLTPSKPDGVNGITAFDAALVLQHAAGLTNLTGYAAQAADVDKSGAITAMDAFYILQQAVGLSSLPFPGAGVVWDFNPTNRTFNNLNSSQSGQDFTGILIGDVSGNWDSTASQMKLDSGGVALKSSMAGQAATFHATAGKKRTSGAPVVLALRQQAPATLGDTQTWLLVRSPEPGIVSLDLVLGYDATKATVGQVQLAGLGSTLVLASSTNEPGTLRAALAGAVPLRGVGALLRFALSGPGVAGLRVVQASVNEGAVAVEVDTTGITFDTDGDGDGQSDWQEIQAGTDPNDKNSSFGLSAVVFNADGSAVVTLRSVPGKTYRLQFTSRLTDSEWIDLGVDVLAQGDTLSFKDETLSKSGERYYRVRLVQ